MNELIGNMTRREALEYKRQLLERKRELLLQQQPDQYDNNYYGNEPAIGWGLRALQSFALTPEGKKKILSQYLDDGEEIVWLKDMKQLGIRDKQGDLRLTDPSGWGDIIGDIADLVGYLPEVVYGTAGGLMGAGGGSIAMPGVGTVAGMIAGAGGGAMLGRATQTSVADMFGAQEKPPGFGALGAAFSRGALGEAMGQVGARAVGFGLQQAVKPFAKWFGKMGVSGENQAIRQAAKELGIPVNLLPASALTESNMLRRGEQYVRQGVLTTDIIKEHIDEPFNRALLKSFGELRESIRGLPIHQGEPWLYHPNFPLRAGIDLGDFEDAVVRQVVDSREATGHFIDVAYKELTKLVPESTPVEMPNTAAFLGKWTSGLAEFPSLRTGQLKNVDALAEAVKQVKDLGQMKRLKQLVGQLAYDEDTYGKMGDALYANIMSDFEYNFSEAALPGLLAKVLPEKIAEQRGSEAIFRWKRYLGLAKRNYALDKSKAVRQVFGKDKTPDLALLDDMAVKVARCKSRRAIQAFKQRIRAVDTPEGIPSDPKGEFLWDQMKQLLLDRIIVESLSDPAALMPGANVGQLHMSGRNFYNRLFGPQGLGEDIVEEIYGAAASKKLKNIATVLLDGTVAQRMFANYSSSGVWFEMQEMLTSGFWSKAKAIPARFAIAKNIGLPQAEHKSMLGREYLTEGKVPSVEHLVEWMRYKLSHPVDLPMVRHVGLWSPVRKAARQTVAQVIGREETPQVAPRGVPQY